MIRRRVVTICISRSKSMHPSELISTRTYRMYCTHTRAYPSTQFASRVRDRARERRDEKKVSSRGSRWGMKRGHGSRASATLNYLYLVNGCLCGVTWACVRARTSMKLHHKKCAWLNTRYINFIIINTINIARNQGDLMTRDIDNNDATIFCVSRRIAFREERREIRICLKFLLLSPYWQISIEISNEIFEKFPIWDLDYFI